MTRFAVIFVASFLAVGCGSARRGEPIAGPLSTSDPAVLDGRDVFMKNCQECHPGGEAGVGPAINNKPLPGRAIRIQVRTGAARAVGGGMPAFSKDKISEEQLDHLLDYIETLKKK
jgi:mono/diheme cytochrome c family protein